MKNSNLSFRTHQSIVLTLTFVAYASYHATRKTTSIVKSVLDPENSPPSVSALPWPSSYFVSTTARAGWAPFDGPGGTAMLGMIDVAFLSVYALGMYFAGHLGDRVDLRVLLAVGMVGTGAFASLFGAGYWLNVHSFYYYLAVQSLAGLFQSSGWPSVVAVVGNWCGKRRRGLVMGVWNAHTSVGNIFGSLVASALLGYGWGWSFVVPGLVIAVVGLVVFLFLNVSPEAAGIGEEEDRDDGAGKEKGDGKEPLLGGVEVEKIFGGPVSPRDSDEVLLSSNSSTEEVGNRAVGFMEAWRIPGVAPFALCLFFSKLVAYTFLYWLPFYISHTAIEGQYLSNSTAGTLSTIFDVGGVVGGILAGHVSDRLNARAITAASFTYCAIPALFLYRSYGSVSLSWNVALMLVAGVFVNGPYALITTAVSADLAGTHGSLSGNSRALATVTAIIDGTGSLGAAAGPLLTGYVSARSWGAVFTMLMAAALAAGLLLTRLVVAEAAAKIRAGAAASTPAPEMEERAK